MVIKELANILSTNIRKGDLACRYGGEEFAMILPHTSLLGAQKIATKLIKHTSKMNMKNILKTIDKKLTVSIGIGVFKKSNWNELDAKNLIKQADQGLYKAKNSGKNQYASINLKKN